ncbi:hypothetical protein JGH11_03160 [Dysgonomonas sp. Marseille-P4677]|uniref:glycosyl hydrolase family 28-related protein n=1 Tax=Dysgonomonas sp. Marseille-P4677 TaxID=2364790 RepID=UPI0019148AAA|nr:glycosyl hydrolase family 28-related protein [Dysgonomonas sp. Marseille-P4677]MBK5719863.1 hypothetical protein [Dysgonomonas sp. Marseille-P4677]
MKNSTNTILLLLGIILVTTNCNSDVEVLEDIQIPKGADAVAYNNAVTYNMVDYGADNEGKVDCSTSFNRILTEIKSNNVKYVDIYFPPGRYKVSRRLVFNSESFKGFDVHKGFIFRGAGEDVTELVCDNDAGVLSFNVNTNLFTATIKDLSFVTARDGKGAAIQFNTTDGKNAGDHHSRMLQVKNVLIRGEKFNQGHFKNGILCYNAWYPLIDNVKITSRYGPDSKNYKMNIGMLFEDSYSPLVTNSYFWGTASYGFLYRRVNLPVDQGPEDGIIKDSYFVGQDHGIYVDLKDYNYWTEPAFHVTNCHINYQKNGVFLKGVRQGFITNNLFYCLNKAGSKFLNNNDPLEAYYSVDINCHYATDLIISNNQFQEPSTLKRAAIDISSRSANISINDNIFNCEGIGIRNSSTKTSYAVNNIFGGTPNFTGSGVNLTRYVDNAGGLKIVDIQ